MNGVHMPTVKLALMLGIVARSTTRVGELVAERALVAKKRAGPSRRGRSV